MHLTALAATGYSFQGWSGACGGQGASCTFTSSAGNSDDTTARFKTTGSPTVTFTTPARIGKTSTLSASASSPPGNTKVEYKIGGVVRATSTSGPNWTATPDLSAVPEGTTTIQAVATDSAGQSTAGALQNVLIDKHAGVMFASGPADKGVTNANQVSYGLQFDADTTAASCKLDGNLLAANCKQSSLTVPLTGDGTHTLVVHVSDDVGNATDITRSVVVDRTPPTIAIEEPNGPFGPERDQLGFTVIDATNATTTCKLDDQPSQPCQGSADLSQAQDGGHDLTVSATDEAGNVANQTRRFDVDRTAPGLKQTQGPAENQPLNTKDVTVGFDAGDANRITCARDGEPPRACTGGQADTETGLADGIHQLTVSAKDAVGNVATFTRTWIVDTVAPTLAITAGPAEGDTVNARQTSLTWDAEPGTTLGCSVDQRPLGPCTTPTREDAAGLADGAHAITVRATDAAGNSTTRTRSFSVKLKLQLVNAPIGFDFASASHSKLVAVNALKIKPIQADASVRLTCTGKSCPFTVKTFKPVKGAVDMVKAFKRRKLKEGTRLEVQVTAPDTIGKVARYTLRGNGKRAKKEQLCLPPGAKSPKRC